MLVASSLDRPVIVGAAVVLALAAAACDAPTGDRGASGDDPPGAQRAILEEMLRDREAQRHSSDGGGRAWLEPVGGGDPAVASTPGRWTIVFEAGPEGIAEGGAVRLIVSPFWHWSPAQISVPEDLGFTSVETDAEGVELDLSVPSFLNVVISGRKLEAGERIRFVYGAGRAGALADRYAERHSPFRIGVDGDGDGIHKLILEPPGVDVIAGPPAQLHVVLPGTARPGDPVRARIAVLDPSGNAGVSFEGDVELSAIPAWPGIPETVRLQPGDAGVKMLEVEAGEQGVFRIAAQAGKLIAISNPMLVETTGPRVLWGDLHGHSMLSDGTGTAEDYLRYARDVAGLDVIALTDHDHWGFEPLDENPEVWDGIRSEIERFNEPGRFVTLCGYEWTNWIHGHRHVLYFDETGGELFSSFEADYDTPPELWDALRGSSALTFAHHSAGGPVPVNWDFPPDPELEPITEIASVHGSSEAEDSPFPIYNALPGNWVRDVLDRGYRFGFVGSGDSHDGHPGLAHLEGGKGGLAAILAPEPTRDGVYGALKARRAYATNGPRIILRAALAGLPMGSELTAPPPGESADLYVRAITHAPLDRIDVIRRGRVDQSLAGEGAMDYEATFELKDLAAGEYVYVRVIQQDGGAAWSSPFFVNGPGLAVAPGGP
jgi:hypothetical protein